jgi:hypothetical protein
MIHSVGWGIPEIRDAYCSKSDGKARAALSLFSGFVWFAAADDLLPQSFGQDLDHLLTRVGGSGSLIILIISDSDELAKYSRRTFFLPCATSERDHRFDDPICLGFH